MGKNQKENIKNKVILAKQQIKELIDNDKYELKNNVVFILAHIDRILDGISEEARIKWKSQTEIVN